MRIKKTYELPCFIRSHNCLTKYYQICSHKVCVCFSLFIGFRLSESKSAKKTKRLLYDVMFSPLKFLIHRFVYRFKLRGALITFSKMMNCSCLLIRRVHFCLETVKRRRLTARGENYSVHLLLLPFRRLTKPTECFSCPKRRLK